MAHAVHHDQAIQIFKLLKHFHAASPAVNDLDLGRQGIGLLQQVDDMHANAFIGKKGVADPENHVFSHESLVGRG